MKTNNENQNRNKTSFSSLLDNNRFLLIFSIVISFVLWMWISIEKSPEIEKVITDVPVQISIEDSIPEQLGLEIFGQSDFTVDVTVKGKKYILASLTNSDINVVASTNRVDSAGAKTLQLKITPTDNNDDFTIMSSSSTYVEVYFDTYKEVEMALNPVVNSDLDSIVPEKCLLGDVVFSKKTVLVSGPATEINRITGVTASVSIDSVLEKTTTFEPEIKLATSDGSTLKYSKINLENNDITMTLPVLKIVTLPTAIEFRNAPSYFINNPLNYTISPSTVRIALPIDAIETTKYFVVDTIDFSDIHNSYNTFQINVEDINSYKIMDDNIKSFRVRIDASEMVSKTLTISASKISVSNSRDDYTVKLNNPKDVTVTIVGTQSDIEAITEENLSIVVNTSDKTISNETTSIQGTVVISGEFNCWAIGKTDIKVTVTEN